MLTEQMWYLPYLTEQRVVFKQKQQQKEMDCPDLLYFFFFLQHLLSDKQLIKLSSFFSAARFNTFDLEMTALISDSLVF